MQNMALTFPTSPSVDDTYVESGRTWKWNGSTWKIVTGAIIPGSIGTTELASTAVTAGSYTATNITVDAKGRITSASSGTGFDAFDDQVFLATQIWS
jgi:hypothetical protein